MKAFKESILNILKNDKDNIVACSTKNSEQIYSRNKYLQAVLLKKHL